MRTTHLILCLILTCVPGHGESQPASLFPPAIVTADNVSEAIRFEWELRKVYEVDPKPGEAWFSLEEGNSSILITAPHATAQMREGQSKWADAGTGALAHMLHVLTNSTVLYTTRRSPQDPNFYDDCDFKRCLAAYISRRKPTLVLDLHASSPNRPYDVDLGTLHCNSLLGNVGLLPSLVSYLRGAGFSDFSQDYFAADKNQTDTKFVAGHGVPCIQLEFSEAKLNLFNEAVLARMSDEEIKQAITKANDVTKSSAIVDYSGAHQFAQTLEALVRFIDSQKK